MARKFGIAIDLQKNELQNATVQNLSGAPAAPVKGQLYMNSTDNTLYYYDGTTWQSAKGGSASFPGYGSVPAETTFALARADGVATTVARSDHTHGSPVHDAAAHATIPLSALAAATAPLNMGGFRVTNVADPTTATDATTKQYVDALSMGLSWKDSVRVASTANSALAGLIAVDGVTVASGDRVLLKNQTAAAENGIYVAAAGAWARATDADSAAELSGATVFVESGTANSDTAWMMSTDPPITLGTTALSFVQFAGAGTVVAGAGMTQAGNTLNVIGGTGITVAADSVAVDAAYFNTWYQRKASVNCLAALTTALTHNFNTRNVGIAVYRNSTPWDTVDVDEERPDLNNILVRFSVAPAAGEYVITAFG